MNLLTNSVSMATSIKAGSDCGTALTHQPVSITETVTRILADNEGHYTGPGTNTYLIGSDRLWILDPGPHSQAHVDAIMKTVAGRPVEGILVTHSQLDHSPAAALLQNVTGAPIYGHSALDRSLIGATDEDIDPDFMPDRCICDGEVLGQDNLSLKVMHTPGHYPNHLAFWYEEESILFSGDHVLGWSTTVVVPPLGNLPDYMTSLKRMETIGARVFLPSHGPVITDPVARCQALREHRLARHEQISGCLERGITEASTIVSEIYEALPSRLIAAAIGQVTAHLLCYDEVPALCEDPAR